MRRKWLVRGVLWALVVAAGAFASSSFRQSPQTAPDVVEDRKVRIGGPFALTSHTGTSFTDRDLLGRPTLMFFGFTHCAAVCPTTLGEMSAILEDLGPDGDKVNALFVSVDPERDTPEQLATYLTMFDRRIVGLSGTAEQIREMSKAYRFYYQKVPLEGGGPQDYTMDHSTMVYVFDRDGRFSSTLDRHEDPSMVKAKLDRLFGRRT